MCECQVSGLVAGDTHTHTGTALINCLLLQPTADMKAGVAGPITLEVNEPALGSSAEVWGAKPAGLQRYARAPASKRKTMNRMRMKP